MKAVARNKCYFATAKSFRENSNHFVDTTLPAIGDDLNTMILAVYSVI
jgi:hypothetical protein